MYNIHEIACFGNSHNEDGFHPSVELEAENEQKAPSSGKVNELHPTCVHVYDGCARYPSTQIDLT